MKELYEELGFVCNEKALKKRRKEKNLVAPA